jgi:tetratricopeptide (TPR) repeat protein
MPGVGRFALIVLIVFGIALAGCEESGGNGPAASAGKVTPAPATTPVQAPEQSELEETAQLLNEMYGFNVNVGTPQGVAAALVKCTARGVNGEAVDGSFALVVRDGVVLVPLARLLRGDSVVVKAACCEEREATGVYAFDARAGLALLAVPGLEASPWTGGYAELPEPAPHTITARVGFPFEVAGSLGIGTSTLEVMREGVDPLRGRRLRLDHSFRLLGAGAVLIDEAGTPMGISTEWAGNDKSWAAPITEFLAEHTPATLNGSAIIALDDLIDHAPDDAARSIMLTMRAGSEVDQRALLDVAIDLEPANAAAHYHRGVVLDMQGDKPGSIAALERSVGIDATWSEPWYSLGLVRLTSGDPPSAGEAFERAIALDDTHADAHAMLGVAAMHAGDARAALGPMRRAIEIEPERMQFAMNLELAYEKAGRGDEAFAAWEAYVAARPDDRRGHARYCQLLALGRRLDRLLEVATAGEQRFGENADDLAFQALAIGLAQPGDPARARALAGRALELEPGHQVATLVLDRVR